MSESKFISNPNELSQILFSSNETDVTKTIRLIIVSVNSLITQALKNIEKKDPEVLKKIKSKFDFHEQSSKYKRYWIDLCNDCHKYSRSMGDDLDQLSKCIMTKRSALNQFTKIFHGSNMIASEPAYIIISKENKENDTSSIN